MSESASQTQPTTILFVEASSGGIVGGSLTGLVHQIEGMGPEWRPVLALYERKSIEPDLRRRGVSIYHVPRRRVPKTHPLQQSEAYWVARRFGWIHHGLRLGRLGLRTLVEDLPAALALRRVIRRERPAVVHLGNGVRANFDGILACWMTGTPCVCHVKGFEKYSERERFAAPYVRAMICMTQALRKHCEDHGVRAPQMHVIYDALADDSFRPLRERAAVRAELGIAAGDCAIGIVGGVQEWKGQAVVVEAVARARVAVPQLRCLIVGGVHRAGRAYAKRLKRRVAELGMAEAVHFLGFRHDVPDIVNALDILVHASVRPEPFGRVILEGMLLGRPVIATAAGGVPEFVADGRTGILVAPGDADALARKLVELARDEALRRRLGKQAQAEVRERFSLAEHVRAVTSVYRSVKERHNV